MTRGLYIAVAVAGLTLVAAAAATAVVAFVPPGDATAASAGELAAAVAGAAVAWFGLVRARAAGEYDFRPRRDRVADAAVVVSEVSFDCPGCGRTYRAAGQVAGRPFACRACGARFTVPGPAAAG